MVAVVVVVVAVVDGDVEAVVVVEGGVIEQPIDSSGASWKWV